MKTLGWFEPLSTAGQPTSVNQIGFDCGTHAVGVPASTPPGRLKCWFSHHSRIAFGLYTHGLPCAPSVIGSRVCAMRSGDASLPVAPAAG
jgi:hypothetical protein